MLTTSDERYPPVRKSTEKEISMTNHKDFPARSGRIGWWLTGKFMPNLLIGVFVLTGYLALPLADSSQPAQGAPKPAVAGGPTIGYAVAATPEQRLVDENPIQTYTAWLQSAHAHAALHGEDAPLPSQF
jgi:hypothetical protein